MLKILEGTVANVPPQGGRKHPNQEMIHIDTTNILFICGGAFDGMERVIERRMTRNTIGFGADIHTKEEKDSDVVLSQVQPEDLLHFGLIPEFIGRLPVVVTLNKLDEDALVRVLTEPKNALIRQYQSLLAMDGVELEFEDAAVRAIARKAIARNTGARGLRSIIEKIMQNVMFQVPSMHDVSRCIVTEEVVSSGKQPVLVHGKKAEPAASHAAADAEKDTEAPGNNA